MTLADMKPGQRFRLVDDLPDGAWNFVVCERVPELDEGGWLHVRVVDGKTTRQVYMGRTGGWNRDRKVIPEPDSLTFELEIWRVDQDSQVVTLYSNDPNLETKTVMTWEYTSPGTTIEDKVGERFRVVMERIT